MYNLANKIEFADFYTGSPSSKVENKWLCNLNPADKDCYTFCQVYLANSLIFFSFCIKFWIYKIKCNDTSKMDGAYPYQCICV